MNDRISGNIISNWANGYYDHNLVNLTNVTGGINTLGDYSRLNSQWDTITPVGVRKTDYNPSFTTPACPGSTSGGWEIAADAVLPTVELSGLTGLPTQTGSPSTVTSPPQNTSAKASSPKNKIIGGVVGTLGLIALLSGALWLLHLLKTRKKRLAAELPEYSRVQGPPEYHHGPSEMPEAAIFPKIDPTQGHVSPYYSNELSATFEGVELPGRRDDQELSAEVSTQDGTRMRDSTTGRHVTELQ